LHRSRNPAANHAAEAVAIYDLQRPVAVGSKTGELLSFQAKGEAH
jgi:hypothetical protein